MTSFCYTRSECSQNVRSIQDFHQNDQGWKDIGYNFLVGGDGAIYEGLGWDIEGAHTWGYNQRSIGIAFIGNYKKTKATDAQVNVTLELLQRGVDSNKLRKDYKLLGHRQVSPKESPGEMLYRQIVTWKHWSPVAVECE